MLIFMNHIHSAFRRYRRSMGEETEPADDDMEVMDERMAALVLTSLSCSPASPKIPAMFGERSMFDLIIHFIVYIDDY